MVTNKGSLLLFNNTVGSKLLLQISSQLPNVVAIVILRGVRSITKWKVKRATRNAMRRPAHLIKSLDNCIYVVVGDHSSCCRERVSCELCASKQPERVTLPLLQCSANASLNSERGENKGVRNSGKQTRRNNVKDTAVRRYFVRIQTMCFRAKENLFFSRIRARIK